MPLFKAFLLQPLQRSKCGNTCCGKPHRQEDLNARYVGKEFDVTARYATVMTNMCIVLLYFGGVPLLLPVGLFCFSITYAIDKYLLLRFYAQPPQYVVVLWACGARVYGMATLNSTTTNTFLFLISCLVFPFTFALLSIQVRWKISNFDLSSDAFVFNGPFDIDQLDVWKSNNIVFECSVWEYKHEK